MKKVIKNTFFISLIFLMASCKSAYRTVDFEEKNIPRTPDYASVESWAILPDHFPADLGDVIAADTITKKADVFFIYPTLLTDRRSTDWNADIWEPQVRNEVLQTAVKYQASAWSKAANLYVPFYRQAHYRIFIEPYGHQGSAAWDIAFEDIKNAFEYYLKHYNKGKPIIIAAHSQGSMHAIALVKAFFDDKPLQKQLVSAYLVGTRVFPDEFKTVGVMTQPDEIGGFVSWNAYKMNKLPKNYQDWFVGGVTTNPVSWDDALFSNREQHKGVLDKELDIYPNSLTVTVIDGLLWTTLPDIPGKFFLSFIKNYHFADINLFWKDIQENAVLRVDSWYKKNSPNE